MVNGINSSSASVLASLLTTETTSTTSTTAATKHRQPPSAADMLSHISQEAGGDGKTITKDQLQSLIDKAKKDGKDPKMLEDLMSNFDKISSDGKSITASDLEKAMKNGTLQPPGKPPEGKEGAANSRNDYQDPTTVTDDQLESPIDIRV
jgi:hypothetical protein